MSIQREPKNSSSPETLIIGAGLAGLAAAAFLKANNREVLVVEAADEVGGRVRTDVHGEFLLDRGFQVLLTAYPELERHVDLDALDLCYFEPGAVLVKKDQLSRLIDPAKRPLAVFAAALSRSLKTKDKLRLLKLRILLSKSWEPKSDTSMESALQEFGFSREAIGSFFFPLLSGIQLTPRLEGSARLGFYVLGCLFRGSAALPSRGMGEIPKQMSQRLSDDSLMLNSPVESIVGRAVFLKNGLKFQPAQLIVATDGPSASQLLGIETVYSRSQTCMYFSAPAAPSKDSAIFLAGDGQGPVRNMAILSNVASSYATGKEALIVAAMPGDNHVLPDEVLTQMRRWFGESVDEWHHLKTFAITHSQPLFEPGRAFRRPLEISDNCFVCGDHRDTPSIQGALVSGRRVAETILSKV